MTITRILPVATDPRGAIFEVMTGHAYQHLAVVTFKPGACRGDHWHPQSRQAVYVLAGKLYAFGRMGENPVLRHEVNSGDLIVHEPEEAHAFFALTDAIILCMTSGPRGGDGYETDTVRLERGALQAAYDSGLATPTR